MYAVQRSGIVAAQHPELTRDVQQTLSKAEIYHVLPGICVDTITLTTFYHGIDERSISSYEKEKEIRTVFQDDTNR